MNRREFASGALVAAGALLPRPAAFPRQDAARVNGDRLNQHLTALSQFGRTPEGGISRVAYSDADLDAREYVTGLMNRAGLRVHVDVAGNLIGTRAGRSGGGSLMFGSHIDSVPGGGNYDGQVGSMGAIEVAHTLNDRGITTEHPLEVMVFQNEEGGKTGSRALAGEVPPDDAHIVTASGYTIRDGTERLGGDWARLHEAARRRGDVHAYFELHIEQGALLHRANMDVGVVEGIVGIKRWNVEITGFANHAGTTPMDARQDALVAASMFIQTVHETARELPGRQVATVGRIQAEPGAPNVIPGRVTLTLEIRDLAMDKIDEVREAIGTRIPEIERQTGTTFVLDPFYLSRAAPTDLRLRDLIEQSAERLGVSAVRMPSGAGHDAQSIAQFAPAGMIFVPSVDGISHSPDEFSAPDKIARGADVLLHAILAADRAVL